MRPFRAATAASLLALAACSAAGPPAPPGPADDPLAFARCMREHGVEVTDPDGSGGTLVLPGESGEDGVRAAQRACEHLLTSPDEDLDPADRAARHDAMVAFARCMRAHGQQVPDPGPDGSLGGGTVGARSFDDGPAFQDALDACDHLLPNVGPGSAGP